MAVPAGSLVVPQWWSHIAGPMWRSLRKYHMGGHRVVARGSPGGFSGGALSGSPRDGHAWVVPRARSPILGPTMGPP